MGAKFYGGQSWWSQEDLVNSVVPFGGATHVLAEETVLSRASAALEAGGLDASKIIVFNRPDESRTHDYDGKQLATWSSLLDHGDLPWTRIDDMDTAKSSIAMHLCTSRTGGGTPKVAQLSHYSAIAHIFQWCQSFKSHSFELKALQFLHLDTLSGHAFLSTAVKLGFPVYLLRYSVPDIVAACGDVKPSLMMVDPHTMMQVIKSVPEGSSTLQSLRDVRLVGMAFPVNARQAAKHALHPECLMSRPYGLTETGSISAALYEQRKENDPDSVGFTYPGTLVKLVDEEGTEITTQDSPGEILVRSPALFSGYINNPTATQDAFRDDWFITGDIGYYASSNQQWYLIGRKTSLFKVSGTYVVPEDIESQLVAHADIADAAVTPMHVPGKADPVIRALVVPKTAGKLTEGDVLAYANSTLPSEKTITGGVQFISEIPRSGLRKALRWKIKALATTTP